jgi:DNA repair exonuclease SbcCD ATPase subunit
MAAETEVVTQSTHKFPVQKVEKKKKDKVAPAVPSQQDLTWDYTPRIEDPDTQKIEESIEVLNKQIDVLMKKRADVQKKIDADTEAKAGIMEKTRALSSSLHDLHTRLKELKGRKMEIQTELENSSKPRELMEKIRKIEYQLMTHTHSVKEEREALSAIRSLKADKKKLAGFDSNTIDVPALTAELEAVNQEIRDVGNRMNEPKRDLDTLKASDAGMVDPKSIEERKGIQKEIKDLHTAREKLYADRNNARDVNRKKFDFKTKLKEKIQEVKDLMRQVEKSGESPSHVSPFLEKINKTNLMIDYLKSLLSEAERVELLGEAPAQEAPVETKDVQYDNAEAGMKVIPNKKLRGLQEYAVEPTGKGKKKLNKQQPKAKPVAPAMSLKDTLLITSSFEEHKLDVPQNSQEVAQHIKTLNERIEDFKTHHVQEDSKKNSEREALKLRIAEMQQECIADRENLMNGTFDEQIPSEEA